MDGHLDFEGSGISPNLDVLHCFVSLAHLLVSMRPDQMGRILGSLHPMVISIDKIFNRSIQIPNPITNNAIRKNTAFPFTRSESRFLELPKKSKRIQKSRPPHDSMTQNRNPSIPNFQSTHHPLRQTSHTSPLIPSPPLHFPIVFEKELSYIRYVTYNYSHDKDVSRAIWHVKN